MHYLRVKDRKARELSEIKIETDVTMEAEKCYTFGRIMAVARKTAGRAGLNKNLQRQRCAHCRKVGRTKEKYIGPEQNP